MDRIFTKENAGCIPSENNFPDLMIEKDLTTADDVLVKNKFFALTAFRAKPTHEFFSRTSELNCYYFVFPRTFSETRVNHGPREIIGPTDIITYRPGDLCRRAPVSPEGDYSDYIAVAPSVVKELCSLTTETDISTGPLPSNLKVPQSQSIFLKQRRYFEFLIRNKDNQKYYPVDPLQFEENCLSIITEILPVVFKLNPLRLDRTNRQHQELSENTKRLLEKPFDDALSILGLSQKLNVSAGHLARVFKVQTGYSIHQFVTLVRLRASIELLLNKSGDISRISTQLGFTHHSHFTMAFRKSFGITPKEFTHGFFGAVKNDPRLRGLQV